MDCCFHALFMLGGIAVIVVALVNKGIPLGSTRVLPIGASVVLGLVLMMPMCCGLGSVTAYGGYMGATKAMELSKANQGRPLTQEQMQTLQASIQKDLIMKVLIIYAVVYGMMIVLALIILLTATEPRKIAIEEPPPSGDYGFRAPPPPDGGYRPRDF